MMTRPRAPRRLRLRAAALWLLALCHSCSRADDADDSADETALVEGGRLHELGSRTIVYLALVDGSVVAWNMADGLQLWNFTSQGRPGAGSHDVVSEYGKPKMAPEGSSIVTELGGQGTNYVLGSDGSFNEGAISMSRGVSDATSILLGTEEDEEKVLVYGSKYVDVYGVDPVEDNMKYCRISGVPGACGSEGYSGPSPTIIVTRTTYTMSEIAADSGKELWNRSSSFFEMQMSRGAVPPGAGGEVDNPLHIVQRAVPGAEKEQWRVDAVDSQGEVRWTKLLPSRLVASFTLANGEIQRNDFNDCGNDTDGECLDRLFGDTEQEPLNYMFKHKGTYFALPSVEAPAAPLPPIGSALPPAFSQAAGEGAPMLGDGQGPAMLGDGKCDAGAGEEGDDAKQVADPSATQDYLSGSSTRTDIINVDGRAAGGLVMGNAYRTQWRRQGYGSTAEAVFTREVLVPPVPLEPPVALEEVVLRDPADSPESSATAQSGKRVTVMTPMFLDNVEMEVGWWWVLLAMLVCTALGVFLAARCFPGTEAALGPGLRGRLRQRWCRRRAGGDGEPEGEAAEPEGRAGQEEAQEEVVEETISLSGSRKRSPLLAAKKRGSRSPVRTPPHPFPLLMKPELIRGPSCASVGARSNRSRHTARPSKGLGRASPTSTSEPLRRRARGWSSPGGIPIRTRRRRARWMAPRARATTTTRIRSSRSRPPPCPRVRACRSCRRTVRSRPRRLSRWPRNPPCRRCRARRRCSRGALWQSCTIPTAAAAARATARSLTRSGGWGRGGRARCSWRTETSTVSITR